MQKGYPLVFKEYLNRLASRRCTKFDVEYARKKPVILSYLSDQQVRL